MKKSFAIFALAICFVLALALALVSCTNELDATSIGGDQKELFVPFQVLSSALFKTSNATQMCQFGANNQYVI